MRKPHKSFGSQAGDIDSRARVEEVSADRPNEVPAADVERPGSELQAGSKVGYGLGPLSAHFNVNQSSGVNCFPMSARR